MRMIMVIIDISYNDDHHHQDDNSNDDEYDYDKKG